MKTGGSDTYPDWTDALDAVLKGLPDRRDVPCPECGVRALRIVFVGNPGTQVGYCSLWCDNCRYGIRPSRVLIPDEAEFLPFDTNPEVVASAIADFREVYPDDDVDDEDEEEAEGEQEGQTR
jgi:hypothetical protein